MIKSDMTRHQRRRAKLMQMEPATAITVSARVMRPMIHQSHLGASHHSQYCARYGKNQIAYVHVNLSSRFSDSATFSYRSLFDSLINNNTQDRWRFEEEGWH
ncbi:hypothetical protein ACVIDN_002225 [Rhizobium brockwellii]